MRYWAVLGLVAVCASGLGKGVTTPKQFLGFDVCADYQLADYGQLSAYWKLLEKESGRLHVQSIGKNEEGRDQNMAIVTDPSNYRNLKKYQEINRRIALTKSIGNEAEARKLAKGAKAVVWIDGGLHSNETISTQSLIETAFRLTSKNDEETKRILKDCIILLVHANPDGMDLVSKWYMRRSKPEERSLAGLPRLYEKYAGHDNNRDFYASNLAETRNMNRILYHEWFPQIVYNHHQTAPSGAIMFVPPFRSPFNHNVDALVQISTDLAGTLIHQRLIAEGKKGSVMRNGAGYSAWWNGGLRTTTYFHNMIGILTELWGSPNPGPIPFIAARQVPTGDLPLPADPGMWHARDSLEYEITANWALLDYASRQRETLVYNMYRAAQNSIDKGSKDSWTKYPSRIAKYGEKALSDPELRDARAYLIPFDQPDLPAAQKFLDRLMICGVEVELGSKGYVVRANQAFRPHVIDMFEPQDHPNDLQYPGGPPNRPYDSAGWTLALQMGVKFEKLFDMPVERGQLMDSSRTFAGKPHFFTPFLPQKVAKYRATSGMSFAWANAVAELGGKVERTASGDFNIAYFGKTNELHESLKYGLSAEPATERGTPFKRLRIGLWDTYGGSMDSGWLRYTLEKYHFDFKVIYPPQFGEDLGEKFDVILFPDGAIPTGDRRGVGEMLTDTTIPAELRAIMGDMNAERIKNLEKFVKDGGRVVAIGSAGKNLASRFSLPVEDALEGVKGTEYYVPSSVLRMRVEPSWLTRGYEEYVDVMFDNSPVYKLKEGATRIAWFDSATPLRSGWALGQDKLKDATAVALCPLGKGEVVLIGPEVNFRAQSDAGFKLLFNALSQKPE
jgi:hypothetical protein